MPLLTGRVIRVFLLSFGLGVALLFALGIFWPRPINKIAPLANVPRPTVSRYLLPWRTESGLETAIVTSTRVRLLFIGDMMLDRNVEAVSLRAKDRGYPFAKLPSGWFDTFDLAIGNLEGPVTDQLRPPVKSIDFQFDPAVIPALKATGLDVLSQANNHALDQGNAGYEDSVRRLREAGFLVFGHQVRDDALALATTTVNGVRIAFLGFNTTDNVLDRSAATQVMATARAQADRVIVLPHWGSEYHDRPDPGVVELGHWFIDHGADAVIGGHPHWVQGFSVYKGKPIAWSLGNFVFDQYFSRETQEGLAVVLTFDGDEVMLEPVPVRIPASQPTLVEGKERQQRLNALAEISDEGLRAGVATGTMVF